MSRIDLSQYHNIVILTGAGVSVASGIRPFRGTNGVWNDPSAKHLSEKNTFQIDPLAVWRFWTEMRQVVADSEPNKAHTILSEIEQSLRHDQKYLLITQNVDGLHERAGSRNIVELHGNLLRSRCSNDECTLESFIDNDFQVNELSNCHICGAILRPDIVFFGEQLPLKAEWEAKKALRDCDLFIAIGTSGTVLPASNYVRGADYAGAHTVYINTEPNFPRNPYFQEEMIGRAEDILLNLFKMGN